MKTQTSGWLAAVLFIVIGLAVVLVVEYAQADSKDICELVEESAEEHPTGLKFRFLKENCS